MDAPGWNPDDFKPLDTSQLSPLRLELSGIIAVLVLDVVIWYVSVLELRDVSRPAGDGSFLILAPGPGFMPWAWLLFCQVPCIVLLILIGVVGILKSDYKWWYGGGLLVGLIGIAVNVGAVVTR